jgi:predicted acylesterase/phospholipase RssA
LTFDRLKTFFTKVTMSIHTFPNTVHATAQKRPHIVFGGGITRALVADLGVLMAARKNGLSFASTGGISAGAVMPLLDAAGMSVDELRNIVMTRNLSDFIQHNHSRFRLSRLVWRIINRRKYRLSLPSKGLYNTTKLADSLEGYVKTWPENYWTMAYAPKHEAQIVFTRNGVHKRFADGRVELVDNRPAPIGLAIRATCAVPGFFDSVIYTSSSGESYELFDGFLSWDGYCPAAFVEKFFGAHRQSIIACDVIKYKTPNRLLDKGYLAVLTPNPPFAAHQFKPSLNQKLAGISEAFTEAQTMFSQLALGDA